ncbi:dynein axonemal intermediate chain 4-like [Daktulosphaira vitifoliae]|uniref:dynein axonemal intermediate chain 4-like n=1 Tax=Daktulosphaira vitifoliae TaxID=58002 RepID=UPI0021AA6EF7|nr:dynein axonemal intermediate chain 4-like [Daktulosphaira vitifoliae]
MDKNNDKISSPQLHHYNEDKINLICMKIDKETTNLKNSKNENKLVTIENDHKYFNADLQETDTITLLELPALNPTVNLLTPEQKKIHKIPQIFDGKKLCLLSNATQTSNSFKRKQKTQTTSILLNNKSIYTSQWQLIQSNVNVISQSIERHENDFEVIKPDLFKKTTFILNRIITSNNFAEKQVKFKTQCIDTEFVSYRYILEEILYFSCQEITNFSITSFVWNIMNENIIAASYGKTDCDGDDIQGIVCCWSLKNPIYPERIYKFDKAITCSVFSKSKANILIVSSVSGQIFVLDITQDHCIPRIINSKNMEYFPICYIVPFMQINHNNSEDEYVLSVDSNGFVRKWSILFESNKIDQMFLIYCGLKNDEGITLKNNSIIVQNMSGTVITFHPIKKMIFYVGTNFGFIVKNYIDNCDDYDDIFMAHNGPVYGIKFSPFFPSVYMTYGADWQIKIWAEDVEIPLLSLCNFNTVEDADWSPVHSTVIVSVSGKFICIWDFARKAVEPVMKLECREDVHFTLVKFSKNGRNIITGDSKGFMRCYHIKSMPVTPFLQKESFVTALKNVVPATPELNTIMFHSAVRLII